NRQVSRAGRDHDNSASWRGRGAMRQPEGPRQAVLLSGGKLVGQKFCLLVADARGQAVLARLGQLADDLDDPFAGLALAKDHFGKAAALAAMEIDVRKFQLGDR